jgi:polyphosphate glucokinase
MDNEQGLKSSPVKRRRRPHRKEIRTLAVDIGGSGIKAVVLDERGRPVTIAGRMKTPADAAPRAILQVIRRLARKQGRFDRVSVGFPGVVRGGVVYTAENLHPKWPGFNLARKLEKILKVPVRVLNDADMQGFGAITGRGVELVITLGTGVGSALFIDGKLVPNLELGNDILGGKNFQDMLGNGARKKIGRKKWNRRLRRVIKALDLTFNYDNLYIGGGNSDKVDLRLPAGVRTVSNINGLLGGIVLWQ